LVTSSAVTPPFGALSNLLEKKSPTKPREMKVLRTDETEVGFD
jgi:hypothetical protein